MEQKTPSAAKIAHDKRNADRKAERLKNADKSVAANIKAMKALGKENAKVKAATKKANIKGHEASLVASKEAAAQRKADRIAAHTAANEASKAEAAARKASMAASNDNTPVAMAA